MFRGIINLRVVHITSLKLTLAIRAENRALINGGGSILIYSCYGHSLALEGTKNRQKPSRAEEEEEF